MSDAIALANAVRDLRGRFGEDAYVHVIVRGESLHATAYSNGRSAIALDLLTGEKVRVDADGRLLDV